MFHRTPDSSIFDISQPDDSIADTAMPDAPMYQATLELLTSTPPSKAWVVNSASTTSAIPSIRARSLNPPSKANKRAVRCSNKIT